MLIHVRPSASMTSWRGASGSGAATTACPRTRAARPDRGWGRLGIRTERVVRGRDRQIARHVGHGTRRDGRGFARASRLASDDVAVRQHLRSTVASAAGPYGYTISLGGSTAMAV